MSIQLDIFFFKQKTAYELLSGLVGSEMCISSSPPSLHGRDRGRIALRDQIRLERPEHDDPQALEPLEQAVRQVDHEAG